MCTGASGVHVERSPHRHHLCNRRTLCNAVGCCSDLGGLQSSQVQRRQDLHRRRRRAQDIRRKVERSVLANAPPRAHVQLQWKTIETARLEDLPCTCNGHVSNQAYARLLAAEIVPSDCDFAIYLDCDVICLGDLWDLVDEADKHSAVSAVPDGWGACVSWPDSSGVPMVFNYRELGIPAEACYFNSGVLVLNMKVWREQNLGGQVIEYLQRFRDNVVLWDQGGLNAVLHDSWFALDLRWNQMASVLYPNIAAWRAGDAQKWRSQFDRPFIIHYEGASKPWHVGARMPRMSHFFTYWKKTEFYPGRASWFVHLEWLIGSRMYNYIWNWRFLLGGLTKRYLKSENAQAGIQKQG